MRDKKGRVCIQVNSNEIIAQLAESCQVEKLVKHIYRGEPDFYYDLCQDIYLSLLTKPSDKIERLRSDGQLVPYLCRMISNNLYSRTSPYYYKYKQPNQYIDYETIARTEHSDDEG